MDNSRRIEYVDIAKGIGIILVVLAHTMWIFKPFIDQFHMALFFFLSGITYSSKYDKSPIFYFFHKAKKLYLAFLFYFGIFILLHNFFAEQNIISADIYSKRDYISIFIKLITFRANEEMGGALWFLRALLFSLIIFNFLRFVLSKFIENYDKKFDILLLIGEGILFTTGYYTDIDFGISGAMVASIFVFLGYEYKKYGHFIKLNVFAAAFCAAGVYILSLYTEVHMGSNEFTNPLCLILSSVLGIYMTITVSKAIEKAFCKKVLILCGKASMTIMALHFLSFKIITYLQIKIFDLPSEDLSAFPVLHINIIWCMLYTAAGVLIPLVLWIIKNKLIKTIKIKG